MTAARLRCGTDILPEREIWTGIGPVAVKVPRVRDRSRGAERISFTPSILPRYLRKAKSVEELLPRPLPQGGLHRRFRRGAGRRPSGADAKGLSAKTVTRLKANWWSEYEAWEKRDLEPGGSLHLGRRCLLQAAHGRGKAMRSGHRRGG